MKFSEKQRKVLICVGAIILAMLIYPPYRIYGREHIITESGYAFLFDLPYRAVVDVTTLLAEWIGVLIVGAIAFLLFMDKHEGFIRTPKEIPSAFADSRFIRTPKEIPEDSGDSMNLNYASPWKRLGALIIDVVVIIFIFSIFLYVFSWAFVSLADKGVLNTDIAKHIEQHIPSGYNFKDFLNDVGAIILWIYYAGMESSRWQGTIGKKMLGLKVVDVNGNRISFWRATGRHFGKILSSATLLVGYIMAFFTKKKQGLHDIMSGCVVIDKRI